MKGTILLDSVSSHREQWHALRSGRITSTGIATIAGFNPYKSAYQLWCEWTGRTEDTFTGNDYTEIGLALEPTVGKMFARRAERSVRSVDALIQHHIFDWAVCTPDAMVDESELLEIKTGRHRQMAQWEDDQTPDNYAIQLQWQLGVCGVSRGHIAALFGADPDTFTVRSFDFDEELFATLVETAMDFLDRVKSDDPPLPGANDGRLLKELIHRNGSSKLFTSEEGERLQPYFAELVELRDRKADLDAEVRKLDAQIKMNENTLKLAAGSSSEGVFANGQRYRIKRIECPEKTVPAYSYERLYILGR